LCLFWFCCVECYFNKKRGGRGRGGGGGGGGGGGSVNYYAGCGSGSDICKSWELVICIICEKEVLTCRGCMVATFRLIIALAFVSRNTITEVH